MDPTIPVVIKDADDLYSLTGNGKYQLLIVVSGLFAMFPCAMQEFMLNFVALDQGWLCNSGSKTCMLNGTLLPENDLKCRINRSEWRFIDGKTSSIVNEFDLVCNQEYWVPLSTALYYISNMIGALVFGTLADRYGRARTSFWCTTTVLFSCFAGAFTPNLWSFQLLRVINGFCLPGTYMVMIILSTEIVSEEYRNAIINMYMISYSLGVSLLGWLAYLVQDWRYLLVYSSAPYFVAIVFLWFVPESFMWLYSKEMEEKLLHLVHRIARINKINHQPNVVILKEEKESKESETTILSLYTTRRNLYITLPMMLAWFSQGLIYYGIELVANNLTGNLYRDFVLLILIEIVACFLTMYCMYRFRRKIVSITGPFIGGLCMVVIGFIPISSQYPALTILRLILALLTKVVTSMSYNVLIVWSAELYPTDMRSKANGVFNSIYMIGAVSAPWVGITLQHLHPTAPFFMMGGCLLLSVLPMCTIRQNGLTSNINCNDMELECKGEQEKI